MRLLAKKPEDRYRSAFELVQDLRRAQEGLPPSFVGAAERTEAVRVSAPLASSSFSVFRRRGYARRKFPWAMAATLAALFALLGVLGWGLSQSPGGVGTVSALEGGRLDAPETSSGTGRDDGGRGASSGVPSASPAGGASAASASASAPASAPTSASPPVQRAFPTPGNQDRGTEDPTGGGSVAEDQYE
jgi:hypothetical protein